MPYSVSNPVNFYAGGDTTSQAIGKHISEFAKVYEILNGLDDNRQGVVVVRSKTKLLKDGQVGIAALGSDWMELKVGDGGSAWMDLPDGIQLKNVVNVLDSTDAGAPLSAAQGKALKELLDAIKVPEIVDDLVTGGADKVLSAEQGKALKALIDAFETPQPGPPGPKGLEWRGAWDAATEYRKGDAVSHQGGSYIALQLSTGEPPTNAEFWGVLSAKGADGTGSGDMTKTVYDTDGDGKVNAAVMADTANAVAWDDVTGKPEKFTCDIVDALDSDRTDAALSAAQGKALKTLVDGIPRVEVVDDLATGGTSEALSAEQGKNLKDLVDGKAAAVHQHTILQVSELEPRLAQIETQLRSLGRGNEMRSDVFFNPGTYDWTVPQDITEVYVTVVGGGGGGGKSNDLNMQGPGGGAGGIVYRKKVAIDSSLWGANITVTVGAGGQGLKQTFSTPYASQSGGTSSFGSFVSATGGAGGCFRSNNYAENGEPGVPIRQAKKQGRQTSANGQLASNTTTFPHIVPATFLHDFSGGDSPFYGLSAGGVTGMDVHSFGAGGNGFRIADSIFDSNTNHVYEYMHGSPGLVVVEY